MAGKKSTTAELPPPPELDEASALAIAKLGQRLTVDETTEGEIPDLYDEDERLEPPTEGELASVAELAIDQLTLEHRLAQGAQYLKRLAEEHKLISETLLPGALANIGMSSFTLLDGSIVLVDETLVASITKANQEAAYAWLTDNGHGDLIKPSINIDFTRRQLAYAYELVALLRGCLPPSVSIEIKESVHAGTLKAFVREQLEKKVEIPEDLFGIVRLKKAVVAPAGGGGTPARKKRSSSKKEDEL